MSIRFKDDISVDGVVAVNGVELGANAFSSTTIPTNTNQLTNGAGYITSSALSGYATQAWVNAQSFLTSQTDSQTLSLSGGTLTISNGNNVNLDGRYYTETEVNNLLATKQAAGTYNTIIGTDTDINTSGATIFDYINVTDGVIQSMGTRTLTLADLGYTGATNANYITNNNQLTNGAGYITGYTETDTLASVTGRGASTSTPVTFNGNVTLGNNADLIFQDLSGTFPTTGKGFDWTLNNDGARLYAYQPASDSIDLVFQLRDNATNNDRFVFHVKEWQGTAYDKYPLVIRGGTQFDLEDSALYTNGTLRLSNTGVLQNVSGNISMFTNNSGYLTSIPAEYLTETEGDARYQPVGNYQPAGTYNTIIGTDTDIDTTGAQIIDNIYVTDGVITSMGTRTLTLANLGYTGATNANYITNNNQLTNGAGYITSAALSGYLTSIPAEYLTQPEADTLYQPIGNYQPAGTYNTIIGTDTDISTSGATIVSSLTMTDGVITAHTTRSLTLANLGYTGATNANYITNNNQLTNGAGYITSSALSGYATEAYVTSAVAAVVDTAPATLNTLNELAAALGDDPNFATTIAGQIGGKLDSTHDMTLTLSGDASGTATFTNMGNATLSVTVADDSHNHTIANVDGLQTALDGKAPSNHTHSYLPLSGGTMTGNITWGDDAEGLVWSRNTDGAYIKFYNTSDGDTNSRLEYATSDNGNEYHRWLISSTEEMTLKSDGLRVSNTIWASGGNSSNWNTAYGWGNHASAGYLTSIPAEYLTQPEADTLYQPIGNYQPAGTYNTIIGTDTDIDTSGATIIDNIYVTDGVITSMGTRTLTLADLGYTGATNANYITNNNQLTNGAGYITGLPSSTGTLTTFTNAVTIESSSDGILNLKQTGLGGTAGVKNAGWNYIQFLDSEGDRQGYFGVNSSGSFQFASEITGLVYIGGDIAATRTWVQQQGYLTSQTDSQTLSWNGSTGVIAISGGNSIDIDGRYAYASHTHSEYLTSIPAEYLTQPEADVLYQPAGNYQPAGTYNTIIGTDTDIDTSGSTIIDNIYVTDGVITSMGTRTLTATDIGAAALSHSHTPSQVGLGNLSSSGNSLTGTFTATGDIVAYSDMRLKSNVETIDNALEKVEALRGVSYDKDGKKSVGVIAQEVLEVIPEVVSEEGEYLGVAYGNLVGVLIEAVKELSAEVKELKAKLGE